MLHGHDLVGVLRPLHPPTADTSIGSGLFFAVALGLAAALLIAELWALAKRRRHGIRRRALDALKSSQSESPERRLISQAKLLREIVRDLDGDAAARLSGDAWLQHLDSTFRTRFFTAGEGRQFMEWLYRPGPGPDPDAMDGQLKIFINGIRR
jgi:hypothetical protein